MIAPYPLQALGETFTADAEGTSQNDCHGSKRLAR
jgi:hypothetical protein